MLNKNVFIFLLLAFLMTSCNKESDEVTTNVAKEAVTAMDLSQLSTDVQEMIQSALSKEIIGSGLAAGQRSGNGKSKEDVIERVTGDVTGHLKIERTNEGAHFKWHSIGLTPGDAVTTWIILFTVDGDGNPIGPVDVL